MKEESVLERKNRLMDREGRRPKRRVTEHTSEEGEEKEVDKLQEEKENKETCTTVRISFTLARRSSRFFVLFHHTCVHGCMHARSKHPPHLISRFKR